MSETWRQRLLACEQRLLDAQLDKTMAKDLCRSVMGRTGTAFYLFLDEHLSDDQLQQMNSLEQRLLQGEPLAYVIGETNFFGLLLQVDARVLIPRPETEELVEWILSNHPSGALQVADLATGSGNIALALKAHRPEWKVTGSDVSLEALAVARNNGLRLGLDVQWLHGNLFEPHLQEGLKYHLIAANLPYVAYDDELQASVFDYEPHLALFADHQGLALVEAFFAALPQVLVPGGDAYLEFGAYQQEAIHQRLNQLLPQMEWEFRKDRFGRDRMVHLHYSMTASL